MVGKRYRERENDGGVFCRALIFLAVVGPECLRALCLGRGVGETLVSLIVMKMMLMKPGKNSPSLVYTTRNRANCDISVTVLRERASEVPV